MSTNSGSSVVVGREACPQCRNKGRDRVGDNLIRYEDGHAHCFACKHHVPSTAEQLLTQAMKQAEKVVGLSSNSFINMPADASRSIAAEALNWLAKYGITRDEIIANDLRWSDSKKWLLFPIYSDDQHTMLRAWQARCFGEDKEKHKWFSRGPIHQTMHIVNLTEHENDDIVLVEDVVSAIKVGRYSSAMPLFGSELSLDSAVKLRHLTTKVIIWLDGDKWADAIEFMVKRFNLMSVENRVVYTQQDPKECPDNLIKEILLT